MSDTVIRVENLGKKYIIGHQQQERYTALRDVMANAAKSLGRKVMRPFGNKTVDPAFEEFWALKDVSFEVKQGDRVGIIGRNGAGKSTLLKVLSRITEPTSGRVSIKGRVASLLEVGTGFHPELTGRENIFLNGAILGMGKIEIKKKFDEIVAFAEVEKFLDTPVKRYSSGMYVRLAFAVAAHLEPEILVVDEVLAVGDSAFQKKCLGKMEDVGKEGRTVLFVSHNMGAIKELCKSSILLDKGKNVRDGLPIDVIKFYLENNSNSHVNDSGKWLNKSSFEEKLSDISLLSVGLNDASENYRFSYSIEESISVVIEYQVNVAVTGLRLILQLQTIEGTVVLTSYEDSSFINQTAVNPGKYIAKCDIPPNFLNTDNYYVSIGIDIPKQKVILSLMPTVKIEIVETTNWRYYKTPAGVVRPKLRWTNFNQ